MKIFKITTLILIISASIFANQKIKHNSVLNRDEVYKNGRMIGYYKYNSILKRDEYYNSNGQKQGYIKKNEILDRDEEYNNSGKQTSTIKYNKVLDRKEVYKNGRMVGYYKHNTILNTWDYYDL